MTVAGQVEVHGLRPFVASASAALLAATTPTITVTDARIVNHHLRYVRCAPSARARSASVEGANTGVCLTGWRGATPNGSVNAVDGGPGEGPAPGCQL